MIGSSRFFATNFENRPPIKQILYTIRFLGRNFITISLTIDKIQHCTTAPNLRGTNLVIRHQTLRFGTTFVQQLCRILPQLGRNRRFKNPEFRFGTRYLDNDESQQKTVDVIRSGVPKCSLAQNTLNSSDDRNIDCHPKNLKSSFLVKIASRFSAVWTQILVQIPDMCTFLESP